MPNSKTVEPHIVVDRYLSKSELQPGDILLSRGIGPEADAIAALDGGSYSHAAIWTGEKLLESTLPNVIEHSLEESLKLNPRAYIDVFRHISLERAGRLVVDEARRYLDRPYPGLALGAVLVTAAPRLPSDELQLQWLLKACGIHQFLELDRERSGQCVTCTELISRAFDAADKALDIESTPAGQFNFELLEAKLVPQRGSDPEWKALLALVDERYAKLAGDRLLVEVGGLRDRARFESLPQRVQTVARAQLEALSGDHRSLRRAEPLDISEWGPCLVTPHYLETSATLEKIGRLYPTKSDDKRSAPSRGRTQRVEATAQSDAGSDSAAPPHILAAPPPISTVAQHIPAQKLRPPARLRKPSQTLRGHTKELLRLVWSPSGERLATTSVDEQIRIWDAASGTCQGVFAGHHGGVNDVVWDPDEKWLVSCSFDRSIKLWKLDELDRANPTVIGNHRSDVRSLSLSSDGKRLLSASEDRTIRLWSSESWTPLKTYDYHDDAVCRVAGGAQKRAVRIVLRRRNRLYLWRSAARADMAATDDASDECRLVTANRDALRHDI